MKMKMICMGLLISGLIFANGVVEQTFAADTQFKAATINVPDVVSKSTSGKEATKQLEAKFEEAKAKVLKEQKELDDLRADIEKKKSVWSNEVRQEKERDFNKKKTELDLKKEDLQFELQQLETKVMGPIFKELEGVIKEIGSKQGYSIIFDKFNANKLGLVVFVNEAIDITDLVREELDKKTAAAAKNKK